MTFFISFSADVKTKREGQIQAITVIQGDVENNVLKELKELTGRIARKAEERLKEAPEPASGRILAETKSIKGIFKTESGEIRVGFDVWQMGLSEGEVTALKTILDSERKNLLTVTKTPIERKRECREHFGYAREKEPGCADKILAADERLWERYKTYTAGMEPYLDRNKKVRVTFDYDPNYPFALVQYYGLL